MPTSIGVFTSREQAQDAVHLLIADKVPEDDISLLTPGSPEHRMGGKKVGAYVGGAIGTSTGLTLGMAAATLAVPGIGPVLALGLGAAALLGFGGVKAGKSVGAGIDSVRLHAEGMALSAPFSQTFDSTLFAALIQGRLPLGIVTPYAEVALGYVAIADDSSENSECNYSGGAGLSLAAGAEVRIARALSAGVRWGLRSTGASIGCAAVLGPWGFEMSRLQTLGVTAAYRF